MFIFSSLLIFRLFFRSIVMSITLIALSVSLKLTICLLVSIADNFCKQFGPRSGPTFCWDWSGSKLFDTEGIPKNFLKKWFWKNISRRQISMQNYPVGKVFTMTLMYAPTALLTGSSNSSILSLQIHKAPPIICSRRQFQIRCFLKNNK